MKKILALALAFAGALSVSGCYTPQQQTGTLAGGAIGAGGGAIVCTSSISAGAATPNEGLAFERNYAFYER